MESIFGILAKSPGSIPLGLIVLVALGIFVERIVTASAPFHQKWSESTRIQNIKDATEALKGLESNQPAKNALHAYVLKQSLILQETSDAIEPARAKESRITDRAILTAVIVGVLMSLVVMEAYFTSESFGELTNGKHLLEMAYGYTLSAGMILFFTIGSCIAVIGAIVIGPVYALRYLRKRTKYLLHILTNRDTPEYSI